MASCAGMNGKTTFLTKLVSRCDPPFSLFTLPLPSIYKLSLHQPREIFNKGDKDKDQPLLLLLSRRGTPLFMSSSYPRIGLSAIVLLLTLSQAPLPSSAAENRFEEDPGNLVITTNSDGEVELPGHRNDVRGLPNMPFSVDANRKSDGLSSISPWTGTSLSFPLYKGGSVYDPSSRTAHEAQTKSSRVTQGVTNKGTGAFEQAQARLKSLVMATASFDNSNVPLDVANGVWSGGSPDPSALPTTDFTVDSTVRWNPSNFAIQSGETYLIEVASSQMWYDDSLDIHVNTLGYDR